MTNLGMLGDSRVPIRVNAAFTLPQARRLSAAMVSVGLAVARGRKHGRAEDEEIGVVVAAEVAVDHRALRILAHARRADDVPGAFGAGPMLDLGRAKQAENLRMRGAERRRRPAST